MSFRAHIKDKISAYLLYIYFDPLLSTEERPEAKFAGPAARFGVAGCIPVQLVSLRTHIKEIISAYL